MQATWKSYAAVLHSGTDSSTQANAFESTWYSISQKHSLLEVTKIHIKSVFEDIRRKQEVIHKYNREIQEFFQNKRPCAD